MANPVQELKLARSNSNRAIKDHNLPGIIASMAPDIVVTVGSGDTISGSDDVHAALYAQFHASPDCLYVRTPKSVKVGSCGTLAFEDGNWTGSWTESDGAKIECGGRYSAAWRKQGTVWLIRSEIFVTLYER